MKKEKKEIVFSAIVRKGHPSHRITIPCALVKYLEERRNGSITNRALTFIVKIE